MSKFKEPDKHPLPQHFREAMEQVLISQGVIKGENKLQDNEFCPVDLWHGTSAHLLPWIKEYGLGGKNIMDEWRVGEFLQWAFDTIGPWDRYDYSNPDLSVLLAIDAAVSEKKRSLNFEYGDLYVTGQYDKAERYALRAPELLDLAREAVNIARSENAYIVDKKLKEYPEIKDFLSLPPKPIVIKLPPVLIINLRNEDGDPLFDFMSEKQFALWSLFSFRVDAVVPFKEIVEIHPVQHSEVYD